MAVYIDPPLNDPPIEFDSVTKRPRWSTAWFQYFQRLQQSGQLMPAADAEYIVAALSASLSAERLLTDTATVMWDFTTPGQARATASGSGGITQLTSDVTAGPGTGSQAATIANDAVTFAKMQNLASQTAIGRNTAGAGDPEAVTISQMLDWTP
jgi:hypothetical protein